LKTARHDPAPIPLLDVAGGNQPQREAILAELAKVLDSGMFLYGPQVEDFESEMAKRIGVKQTVGCASCSDALLLSLMACDVGPLDEVILPSFTFFATASAVVRLGAVPVFVDIVPGTFNIDPNLLEASISSRTRAIMPVHLFGQCAAMDDILDVANRHGIPVIEVAAQAIDATWRGQPAGSMGRIGCFSFYPTKNLGGMGDGGLLSVEDEELATRLRKLAAHGMHPRYYHSEVGINSRLDTFQAAVLGIKLRQLTNWTAQRRENALQYTSLFREQSLEPSLMAPETTEHADHVWNQYTVRVLDGRRDALKAWLAEHQIGSAVYYAVPLHQQPCFVGRFRADNPLSETDRAAREVLSLPCFPELTSDQIRRVVECCRAFFAASAVAA
jgi:dTDP-4-amino-4,6-dideoxygalactose transaminase